LKRKSESFNATNGKSALACIYLGGNWGLKIRNENLGRKSAIPSRRPHHFFAIGSKYGQYIRAWRMSDSQIFSGFRVHPVNVIVGATGNRMVGRCIYDVLVVGMPKRPPLDPIKILKKGLFVRPIRVNHHYLKVIFFLSVTSEYHLFSVR
jgi:hypothetical protein